MISWVINVTISGKSWLVLWVLVGSTFIIISISQIMSTLINVINNGDSEMRKSELLEFFRFHNRKLLKFGIF